MFPACAKKLRTSKYIYVKITSNIKNYFSKVITANKLIFYLHVCDLMTRIC